MVHFAALARRTRLLTGLVLVAIVLAPALGRAEVARMEMYPLKSTTLTDAQFLAGQREGAPVTIAGELRIPDWGSHRLPVVVLVHGSGGVVSSIVDWVDWLNEIGFATFVFDSFSSRGIVHTAFDQDQLGRLAMIIDVYRALELLGKHPRIDPEKIVLMGFSRGGQAVLYASMKRFQQMHGPTNLTFAAYIPLYPACNTTFRDDENVVDRPIRLFHGSADDWVPVAPCRQYVERLRKAGKDVQLSEYADALHVFDARAITTPVKFDQAQTTRKCQLEETTQGEIVNVQTKLPFNYKDPCVERGVTAGHNTQAYISTQKAIRDFLTPMLKSK